MLLEWLELLWCLVLLEVSAFYTLLQVVAVDGLSNVEACLLGKSLLSLLDSCSIENFIGVKIICEHLFEFVIDLLVKFEQLRVRDLENALRVFLAQYFFDLLVKVSHTHQVAIFEVLVQLG